MLKEIGETFSKAIGNVSKNLGSLLEIGGAAKDPKSFFIKKGAEALFSRGYGGGQDMGLVDTNVPAPRFGKAMGFYTPGMAKRSNMMGMQGKTVDPETLQNEWFVRLRRYYFNKKYYS